jgi:hypothetical protein
LNRHCTVVRGDEIERVEVAFAAPGGAGARANARRALCATGPSTLLQKPTVMSLDVCRGRRWWPGGSGRRRRERCRGPRALVADHLHSYVCRDRASDTLKWLYVCIRVLDNTATRTERRRRRAHRGAEDRRASSPQLTRVQRAPAEHKPKEWCVICGARIDKQAPTAQNRPFVLPPSPPCPHLMSLGPPHF